MYGGVVDVRGDERHDVRRRRDGPVLPPLVASTTTQPAPHPLRGDERCADPPDGRGVELAVREGERDRLDYLPFDDRHGPPQPLGRVVVVAHSLASCATSAASPTERTR